MPVLAFPWVDPGMPIPGVNCVVPGVHSANQSGTVGFSPAKMSCYSSWVISKEARKSFTALSALLTVVF